MKNNISLYKFWLKNWIYFVWFIEIIVIAIYLKILYFFTSFTIKSIIVGNITNCSGSNPLVTVIFDSIEQLALKLIESLSCLFF